MTKCYPEALCKNMVRSFTIQSSFVLMSSRSLYISRIRRAFLLRVHPDRFRSHNSQIRKQQAGLVQAISNRLEQPDFLAYAFQERLPIPITPQPHYSQVRYVLEHKDGSLKDYTLNLNGTVEEILHAMVHALQEIGLTSLPLPPTSVPKQPHNHYDDPDNNMHWACNEESSPRVDHQYDIHSNKGRELLYFLSQLDFQDISSRRASRMDVTATASVVRKDFQFLAVDGTGLGWSSATLAILLRCLVDFYGEHSAKFLVTSYYPLRLVLSLEDQPLDIFGGCFYLNPSATPIQWLDHFLSVTPDAMTTLKTLRQQLNESSIRVNNFLGATFQKGNSCSSKEYFELVQRLSLMTPHSWPSDSSCHSIALIRVIIMVESPQACRRAILTSEGHIRIGASMTNEAIVSAVSSLLPKAREKLEHVRLQKESAQILIKQLQSEFGVSKILCSKVVNQEQFNKSLGRLLNASEREEFKRKLVGNAIGIVGRGHFCHLGDDGSMMIPWDWK
jgi:Domain of unknown function (DUF4461)